MNNKQLGPNLSRVTSIRALTPEEQATQSLVIGQADEAALAEAGRKGATAKSIEAARAGAAKNIGKILRTSVDDSVLTGQRASERAGAAEHWRTQALDPNITEEERLRFLAEARSVQAESDNLAGVTDPGVRPEGYDPMTESEITSAKERVDQVRRV